MSYNPDTTQCLGTRKKQQLIYVLNIQFCSKQKGSKFTYYLRAWCLTGGKVCVLYNLTQRFPNHLLFRTTRKFQRTLADH
jgi:hypothetical protein